MKIKNKRYFLVLYFFALSSFCLSASYGSIKDYEGKNSSLFSERKTSLSLNLAYLPLRATQVNLDYNYRPSVAAGVYSLLGYDEDGMLGVVTFGLQHSYALNGDYLSSGLRTKQFLGIWTDEGVHFGSLLSYRWAYSKDSFLDCGLGLQYIPDDELLLVPDAQLSWGQSF